MPEPDRIKQLYERALRVPIEERDTFVRREAGSDNALADAVLQQLEDDSESPTLDRPSAPQAQRTAPLPESKPLPAPKQIGPYRILGVLGEGGFGVVYEAEQSEPVKRRVALKIIKPGMDSKNVVARFEAERQALAVMDHACVAKVFDGGVTDPANGSRPYFAMELVRGEPITDYCDKNRLTIEARVKLFARVCEAVQHAHSKGVIHRDLKPSNIMVTHSDTGPTPKVIDFGVAKAINQRLTESTIFTELGHMIGTPEYMSPEQAEMSGTDIDTRSDVYSLGVVLYELLSGKRPFDGKQLRSAGLAEIQRIIREDDPPRPSNRVSTVITSDAGLASRLAKARDAQPNQLHRSLRGELDWVVMKCLEKDRDRRYDTPMALAAELRRFLHDEPVLAGPPSAIYKVSKFVQRHRVSSSVTAGVAVVVLGSLGFSTSMWFTAEEQRAHAETRRVQADTERARAVAYSEDLRVVISQLTASGRGVASQLGSLQTRQTFAATALRVLESMEGSTDIDPWVSQEIALATLLAAEALYDTGGSLELAAISYERARARFERLRESGDPDSVFLESQIRATLGLGRCEIRRANGRELLGRRIRQAEALIEQLPPAAADRPEVIRLSANILRVAAEHARDLGELNRARPIAEQASQKLRALIERGDRTVPTRGALALSLESLGEIEKELGRAEDTAAHWNEALNLRRSIQTEDSLGFANRRGLIALLGNMAHSADNPAALLEERLELALDAALIEPDSRWTGEDVTTSIELMVKVLPDKAYRESSIRPELIGLALESSEAALRNDPTDLFLKRRVGLMHLLRGALLRERAQGMIRKNPEEGLAMLRSTRAGLETARSTLTQVQALESTSVDFAINVVAAEVQLAKTLELLNRYAASASVDSSTPGDNPSSDDVLEAYSRAIDSALSLFDEESRPALTTTQLALAYRIRGTLHLNRGTPESAQLAIPDLEMADSIEPLPTPYARASALARRADAYRLTEQHTRARDSANAALVELESSQDSRAASMRDAINTQILEKLPIEP